MVTPLTRSPRQAAQLLTLLLVAGCGGDNGTVVEDPIPTSMTITPSPVEMVSLGQTVLLFARVLDQNGSVIVSQPTWVSDNPAVVTVSADGRLVAVSNGTATVTATVGAVTGTVPVTVAQVPVGVLVVSGNNQEATAGTALADPVVARVVDGGGQPVENVTMTFTPDADHGSVSVASAPSDANGEASTAWTLGTFFGPMRLVASIGSASASVAAIARSDTPTPDLAVTAALTITRPDPSTLESFIAQTTVRNTGDLTSGASSMRLLANGADLGSVAIPELLPDEEVTLELTAGPLTAGTYAMSFVADPDSTMSELDETNNKADKSIVVVTQTTVADGADFSISGTTEDELLFQLDLAGPPTTLTIELIGGSGDADLFVDGGGRPSNREDYAGCISAGPTSTERCQLGSATGTYHILVHAFSSFSGTRMQITTGGVLLPYDIEVVFVDNGTATQDQAIINAAARWGAIISADVPDHDFSTNPLPADQCLDGQPLIDGVVDDVRIFVSIDIIDGPGGTLAQAGPCVTRGLTNLPIVGSVEFDEADLVRLEATGDMSQVVVHEMGHILGLGSIWRARGLLQDPSLPDNSGADTHFNGANAIAAFDAAGGASFTGSKVPVENMAGPGSGDTHWRESVLGSELMTPFLNSGVINPLSAISVQSVKDLGYSVDVSEADRFTFTLPTGPARAQGGAPQQLLDLRGDVRQGAVWVVTQKGEIVEIRR
jgi:hypothetical protein